MLKDKLKNITKGEKKEFNKKKIENMVVLVILLVITLIIINSILNDDKNKESNLEVTNNTYNREVNSNMINNTDSNYNSLENGIAEILSTIKGVGEVKVFLNYSESSKTVAMYDETITTSSTEENDSSGGKRNITETENKKNVIYSEEDGNKTPITEKIIMPAITGAIVTAQGANNANIKTNIINAVGAVTGLTIDKIQVFEMK